MLLSAIARILVQWRHKLRSDGRHEVQEALHRYLARVCCSRKDFEAATIVVIFIDAQCISQLLVFHL